MMSQFHLLRPELLALVVPAWLFLFWLHAKKSHSENWKNIVDDALLEHVVQQQPDIKKSVIWLHALALLIAVFAIAGPSWHKQPQPVFEDKSALIIALDLSQSMLAEDVKPNRLSRAKFIIEDILNSQETGQFALITFAKEAFVVTPFSNDKATLIHQLSALTPDIMPAQGTNFADVIDKAEQLHRNNELDKSHLLILTDTLENVNADDLNTQLFDVSILAISQLDGAPIPNLQGSFVKDYQGNIVISQYNKTVATIIGSKTHIRLRQLKSSDTDLAYLLPKYQASLDKEGERESEIWLDQGHYFAWLLLPFFLFWFRKGLFYGLVFFILPVPQADAFDLPTWLLNDNQKALTAFNKKDYQQAAKQFNDLNWKASSLFKQGNFEEAEAIWNNLDDATSAYNAGNAAAKLEKLPEAVAHYKKALQKRPDFQDAKDNLKTIEDFLKQQKEQEKKDQKSDKKDQKQDQSDSKDKKDQKQDQSQDGKKGDKKGEQQKKQQKSKSEKDQQKEQAEKSKGSTPEGEKTEQEKKQQAEMQKRLEQMQKQMDKEKENQTEQQPVIPKQRQLNKTEQWLQQIPDDPGGLLRNKFNYYSQRHQQRDSQQPW
jgi:Ca-activated chloride channel family protein